MEDFGVFQVGKERPKYKGKSLLTSLSFEQGTLEQVPVRGFDVPPTVIL